MKVAVIGATGMVGEVMLQVLAERNFPITELIPVASEKSIGKEIDFKGKTECFSDLDIHFVKSEVERFINFHKESKKWLGL